MKIDNLMYKMIINILKKIPIFKNNFFINIHIYINNM